MNSPLVDSDSGGLAPKSRSDLILRDIAATIGRRDGQDSFGTLVRGLVRTLGMDRAVMGRICGERRDRIEIIAAVGDGAPSTQLEHDLEDTPAEAVAAGETVTHVSGVAQAFPENPELADLGIEGYCGQPLLDSKGTPLGILVAMSRTPLIDADLVRTVVKIFADRAAVELEWQLANKALKKKEAQLRAIVDNAPLAIFLKDREGRYQLINRTYTDWFGNRPEEICGRSHFDIYPAAQAAGMEATDRQVLDHGQVTYWERHTEDAKAGVALTLATKFPIHNEDGEIVGLAGFITNVTAHKQAEEALRRSEERFRALIEHSNDIVALVRPDGLVTYRSPALPGGLGYTPDERIGGQIFDLVHRDDVPSLRATFEEISAVAGRQATGRSRLRHKDGSWRHIAWSARNAIDVPGVDGIIINARDVTDSQRLEEQLLQARKMEAVGQLAGGIAHDFNNILGAILGFASFLVQDLPEGSPERSFAERIVSASERAKDLVQQILAFARRGSVERKPTDLARVALETQELLRASLPASTRLEFAVDQNGLIADVNAAQISQILLNLCLNANDALSGEPGTVAVEISRTILVEDDPALEQLDEGEPPIGACRTTGRIVAGALRPMTPYAKITIADTGTGMDPQVLNRAFDPFFTTKGRGRGTGLGLAVVQGIVAAYDGACVVTSCPGAGSIFDIYLPLALSRDLPAQIEAAEREPRGHERILVIDDEMIMTDVVTVGLGRLGYEVVALNDPSEALALFAEAPVRWSVVISDQVMPGVSGLTLFERMKAIHPSLRFILCTGFSDGATEESARSAGVDAFFLKPVSQRQLAETIRRLIDARP